MIATRSGIPVVRYSDAQPTTDTAGEIGSMALYAGVSVGMVHGPASAEDITRVIARGLVLS